MTDDPEGDIPIEKSAVERQWEVELRESTKRIIEDFKAWAAEHGMTTEQAWQKLIDESDEKTRRREWGRLPADYDPNADEDIIR